MTQYLTPQEVALELRVHIKTVYRYIDEGQFPNIKAVKRSYRIPKEDVTQFLARGVSSPVVSGRRIISRGRG